MAPWSSARPAPFQAGLHSPHLCGPYQAEKTSGVGSLQVYCDLDGVLADFNKGCLALFPEGGCIAEKIPTHTVTRLSYEEESEMWRRVESKSDFFLSLDWTSDGQELWRWIDWNVVPPAAVLTGLPLGRAGQMAAKQKEQWCLQRLGAHVSVFCCGTRNKQKFSGPNCVLIDDRNDLREAWEARGGVFIHHTSAAESIRQLKEVLLRGAEKNRQAVNHMPLQLTSVCWASQTPAGCFKSNCRYLHVPISRRHRCWIQLWGFVWWHQRMFDDLASLVQCIRHVYVPEHQAAFQPSGKDDMDAQSEGAFRKMLETLRECCDLGLPLDFLNDKDSDSGYCLPPLPNQVKDVLATLTELVRALPLGHEPRVVVAGSMGLGADVGGSDLDVVLCCELEVDPQVALVAVRDALDQAEAQDVVLLDQVAVPLLSFRIGGLSVDMTLNQMSSIRDIVLFRYALRNAGPELPATLRLLKMWIKARRIPGTKQGGFPAVVWLRMAVRFYQESKTSAKRVARDWLRRFMVWAWQGLPTGGSPLTLHGEQEYFSGRLASGVSPATLLLFVTEMVLFLEQAPAPSSFGEDFLELPPHAHLCLAGSWNDSWALFFAGVEGSRQVLLCRVSGVIGGPEADLRLCDCPDCSAGEPLSFVSRRSLDWLILAAPVDPQKLRVQTALQRSGVKKKPVNGGEERMLLRPCHLVRRLLPTEDPLRELQRTQQAAESAAWLPTPEAAAPRIPRGVLLRCKREMAQGELERPSLMPLDQVCLRCPWMEPAKSSSREEGKESPEQKEPPEPCEPGRVAEVRLEKSSVDEIWGFSLEVVRERLQVVSISEKGLLGRHNARELEAGSSRVTEGSEILAINGVKGDVEAMRCELEERAISLTAQPSGCPADKFGRKMAPSDEKVLPRAVVSGAMPVCRCGRVCKCGLADALGRAKGDLSWSAAQPALQIRNLHPDVTEEMLYELFTAQHIPVVTVRVVRDTKTFESQFHGYVNFHTFQDAEKALALDGARLCGQRCFLSWSSRARQSRKEPKDPRVAKPEPKRAALGYRWVPREATASRKAI